MSLQDSYFVSDLHVFSRRSQADLHLDAILDKASQARTFVLGGDIFDFEWTTLSSIDRTVDAAIDWLDSLVAPHPRCSFHFVLGNHDSHRQFVRRLSDWSVTMSNFSWHRYYVRLGSQLFLHGDVADRKMSPEKLEARRSRRGDRGIQPPAAHWLYDVAVEARLHRMASSLVHRKRRVAKRILAYLEQIGHGPNDGVQHVFFGHTHLPMSDFRYGGLRFHNGGAPMKGLKFRILNTDIDGLVTTPSGKRARWGVVARTTPPSLLG